MVERGGVPPVWSVVWVLAVAVIVSRWVYADARARGSSVPALWAVSFLPVVFVQVWYVGVYRRRNERVRPRTSGERWTAVAALAAVLSALVAGIVAPPDPVTQLVYWVPSFVAAVPVSAVLSRRLVDEG